MENYVFDKIEQVLNDILVVHKDIYLEKNKSIFNHEIRSNCIDNELARNILLTLVVNDVFLFINEKDYERAERNIYSCLEEFYLYQSDYVRLFEILKISEELKKIRRKQKINKARNFIIIISCLGLCVLAYVINYKSYFRNSNEIFIRSSKSTNAFFISKFEEHDLKGMPLVNMSWYEVINYCNELSKKNNLACVYTIDDMGNVFADLSMPGYRLPTKQEWLWAARRGNFNGHTAYSGNERFSIENYAWYIENSEERMHKVAQKRSNLSGLYDMSGNVAEWCWDFMDTENRTICGGFYGSSKHYIDLYYSIQKHKPDSGEIYIGFRLARSYVRKNIGAEK